MNTLPLQKRIQRSIQRRSKNYSMHLDRHYRLLTSRHRTLPGFLMIGSPKCGTTSLHRYLELHPNVGQTLKKEVNYFNWHFEKGENWYKSFFPLQQQNLMAGDSTPSYLNYPHAPKRAFDLLPSVKLIAMFRNPVDRAYSHYNHVVQRREVPEPLAFAEAVRAEAGRMAGETEKMMQDQAYFSHNHFFYPYLTAGTYMEHLQNWLAFFPKEQMLILNSEEFFISPVTVYHRVLNFLGLPAWELKEYRNANS